ncbi:MAG: MFS transporter [Rhodobacteraceae bacterium]|nr:MFS transporter [Paracoccaceae bacterium]
MTRDRAHFLLLNIGHFLDHLFTLIFASVAALALHREWALGYSELLVYATPGFFAFGLFALPAGWLADRWSRDGMMVVFFVGVGVCALITSMAQSPMQIGLGLFVLGVFAAIYHPVGLAIVSTRWRSTGMRIAVNGIWGNLGVAGAALITGFFIDHGGWRMAFVWPGLVSIAVGLAYLTLRRQGMRADKTARAARAAAPPAPVTADPSRRRLLLRVSAIVFVTTAVSSMIYQSTTFALPKVFDERLQGLALRLAGAEGEAATLIGLLAFAVFATASVAQLVVGLSLDRFGARRVFMVAAGLQIGFFAVMPGLRDGWALVVALGFMLGAFGQIPITDYMIGQMASGAARARVYAVRYVVSFTVLAATLPLIAFVHGRWGFDTLFAILAIAALVIFCAVALLPARLPAVE